MRDDCVKIDYYCDGKRLELNGKKAESWRECGKMCFFAEKCNKWHYYVKNKRCLMYEKCTATNGVGNFMGNKGCPGPGNIAISI